MSTSKASISFLLAFLQTSTYFLILSFTSIYLSLTEFADFAKGYILTAYNVNFDIGFLDETLKRLGIPFGSVEYFDTMKIARQNFKNVKQCTKYIRK